MINFECSVVGTDLHRELSPKGNSIVYDYLATAQKW